MKKIIRINSAFVLFSIFLFSCSPNVQEQHEKMVYNYFSAINDGCFSNVLKCVSDSVLISEFDYILAKSIYELQTNFQWDSVFEPYYEIIELTKVDKNMEAIISKTCKRIRFLHDSAIVYKVNIVFEKDRIKKMETFDYKVFNFEMWQARRDTLVDWINKNHPELSGFSTNQTLVGAQNYLKAINYIKQSRDR